MSSVLMEEMSWTEIEERLKKGFKTVILPVGAIEQQGPHLSILADTIAYGYGIGKRVAKKLGNALVAPCVQPGCSDHHMEFSGTISVRAETLRELVRDYCRSLAYHGFENIVIIVAHGGNTAPILTLVPELVQEFKEKYPKTRIIPFANPWTERYVPREKFGDLWIGVGMEEGGFHGALACTSLMLVERPDLVNMEKAVKEMPEKVPSEQDFLSMLYAQRGKRFSKSGVQGDPLRASKEYGERLFDIISDNIIKDLREYWRL